MIPFPGSRVFKQLEAEGRILTRNWSEYDGTHAVFQPQKMSPEELEKGAYDFYYKINSPTKYTKRKLRQIRQLGFWETLYM